MSGTRCGLPAESWRGVVAAGVGLGIVYALSPLTVWFTVAMAGVVVWACRGLDGKERRWLTILLVTAIVVRLAAVAGLFLVTNHSKVPFGHFFGDEEYFIRRSMWLRTVALGLPAHGADLIYAFDEYSQTIYLYILAFIQVLVGPAPYGAHLLAIGFYVAACVVLYRLVRATLGRAPAFIGLGLLLYLPSLFAWSISALKDPLFFLLTGCTVVFAARLVRGPGWFARALSLVLIVLFAAILAAVRSAGGILTIASLAIGLTLAFLLPRPRWLLASVMAAPIVAGAILSRPAAQTAVYGGVQAAARQHAGHIATAGYVYKLLDERLYEQKIAMLDLGFGEAGRFLVRAIERYITVPWPWEAQSPSAVAYLPEQMLWYLLVALAPIGFVYALRRDPLVASLLLGYAAVAAVTVAVVSGNVGTLVRHRGLALPYIVWLSAVGACEVLSWAIAAVPHRHSPSDRHLAVEG
jgi:hypothetical protein